MPAMFMYSSEQSSPSLLALRKLLLPPLFEKTGQYSDLLKCDDAIPSSQRTSAIFSFSTGKTTHTVFKKPKVLAPSHDKKPKLIGLPTKHWNVLYKTATVLCVSTAGGFPVQRTTYCRY